MGTCMGACMGGIYIVINYKYIAVLQLMMFTQHQITEEPIRGTCKNI
mgnify:FL=1